MKFVIYFLLLLVITRLSEISTTPTYFYTLFNVKNELSLWYISLAGFAITAFILQYKFHKSGLAQKANKKVPNFF